MSHHPEKHREELKNEFHYPNSVVYEKNDLIEELKNENKILKENMRNSIDQMIDLTRVFGSSIKLTKDVNNYYMVDIERVSWKESRLDCMERSITGRGLSIELACLNFMTEAKGKLLYGNSEAYYGPKRPEYLCV